MFSSKKTIWWLLTIGISMSILASMLAIVGIIIALANPMFLNDIPLSILLITLAYSMLMLISHIMILRWIDHKKIIVEGNTKDTF